MGSDVENWLCLAPVGEGTVGLIGYCYAIGCEGAGQSTLRYVESPAITSRATVNARIDDARDGQLTLAQWVSAHPPTIASWLNARTATERQRMRDVLAASWKLDTGDTPP